MKKNAFLLLCCLVLIGFTNEVFSQNTMTSDTTTSTGPVRTKIMSFGFGYANLQVADLNQFLAKPTSGSFSQNFGVFGLQSTTECKRFIYGYTLQAGMSQKGSISNYGGVAGRNMDYYGTFGNVLMHFGYSIVSTDRIKLYPIIGAGFGGVSANYNSTDDVNIDQFGKNPGVEGALTKHMVCFDGALNLDLLMPSKRWSNDKGSYGRTISIRTGYTKGLGVGDWRFKGARVTENPSYNPGMFYVKVQFGMFSKKASSCDHGCKK
jgi:opacity protein-like surface antigen